MTLSIKYIALALTFSFVGGLVSAQHGITFSRKERMGEVAQAKQRLETLKDGVLFIRLHSRTKQIEYLRDAGNPKAARRLIEKQYQHNMAIAKAFKKNYNYSKYYFFYNIHSTEVKEGQYQNVVLNESLLPVANFIPPTENKRYILDSHNINIESMGTTQKGFEVMDGKFGKLERPFPYYVMKHEATLKLTYDDMVKKLQKKFLRFESK
jgi:hypothetical protein